MGDERLPCDAEPAAQVIPERNSVLGAGLGETQKGIAAVTASLAAGAGTDLAADHLGADVVLRAIGVQWNVRPLQQAIERGEAGAPAEDAVKSRAQDATATLAGMAAIALEVGIEVP